jgi:peptidoglycan/xylan/chitin deacetylase (PgdA/CDA1 family)
MGVPPKERLNIYPVKLMDRKKRFNSVKEIQELLIKVSNPLSILLFIQNKYFPRYLWARYEKHCSSMDRTVFLLSFDCDTELDIEVLPRVMEKLKILGIKPVLAVPGELLEKGEKVYKLLAKDGIEFINHGYKQHTHIELPQRIYHSNFFYHKLTKTQIIDDVLRGHQTIHKILEVIPTGFRTPHFGSFQRLSQLRLLWNLLESQGYTFSSSTSPIVGIRKGPVWVANIIEVPVTGCPSWPTKVLDSWGFGFAPFRSVSKQDYLDQISKLAGEVESGKNLVINIYADPSQVYDWPEFFEALKSLAPFNVGSFKQLIDTVCVK